jgi:isoleucyl-tRNA synthetase
MPELERYVLHLVAGLDATLRQAIADFDFNTYVGALAGFANNDLSAFFFDVRKDCLYCDPTDSAKRRAYRTVLDILFDALVKWLAPVLVFTAEEAWQQRYPSNEGSVHLSDWPTVSAEWRDEALAAKWARLREVRRVVTGAIELDRREKRIGASLEAVPTLYVADADLALVRSVDLAELAITSEFRLGEGAAPDGAFALPEVPGVAVATRATEAAKCARCWRHLPEVAEELCERCTDAVAHAA